MAEKAAGRILLAHHDKTYVMRLVGDIRVNLCASIDKTILSIFSGVDFDKLIIDLSETEGIDSTTLGFLAKVSIFLKKERGLVPLIYSPNESITHLLDSMSFSSLFHIHAEKPDATSAADALELEGCLPGEEQVRQMVIDAHKVLMSLSEANRARFCELVESLEKGH